MNEITLLRFQRVLDYNRTTSHTTKQMADELDIPIAAIHRIIVTLRDIGWLEKDGNVWNEDQTQKAVTYRSVVVITTLGAR